MPGISRLLFLGWKSPATSKMEKYRIRELYRNVEVSIKGKVFKSGGVGSQEWSQCTGQRKFLVAFC